MQKEQRIICEGLKGALEGLIENGCNGPCKTALQKLEEYLNEREQLIQVVLLVDMRHKPSNDDIMMFNWMVESGFEPVVIATKKDKVKPSQREDALKLIKDTLNIDDVIPFSSEKGDGVDEVWNLFKKMIGVEE